MKRWVKIVGGVFLALAVFAGGAYWWLSQPVALQHYEMPGPSIQAREQHGAVETMLLAAGVEDAFVDVTGEKAYVGYAIPEGTDAEGLTMLQWIAFDALARVAPHQSDALVIAFGADRKPALQWEGSLATLRQAGDDGDAIEAWIETATRTTL